jgi:hypothetical protein
VTGLSLFEEWPVLILVLVLVLVLVLADDCN